jgi:UDP-N-acetylmuramoyl-tripeptide--D-alanyl-D-alanine ligase
MLNIELQNKTSDIAILIKGSRSAHMEKVVTALIAWFKEMNIEPVTKLDVKTVINLNKEGKA